MFKVNDKNTRNDVIAVVLMFLMLTLNIFHTFSSVSVVDFEQVNVIWVYAIVPCKQKFDLSLTGP